MDRKHQFKRKSETAGAMRDKRRRERRDSFKRQRDEVLMEKRMKKDDSEAVEEEIVEDQLMEIVKELINESGKKYESLKKLKNALSLGTAIIDNFMKVDGTMQRLVELLKDDDVNVQLEASWCLNNIAGGTDDHALAVADTAGDDLINLLSSGNVPLEDQCAWTIGNIASSNSNCREVLLSKKAVEPLIALLKSSTSSVVHCAAFALSNLARDKETTNILTDAGILPHLASLLVYDKEKLDILAEICWVLAYLTACGTHEKEVLEAEILEKLIDVVVDTSIKDKDNVSVLTPMLRSLGNIICSGLDETAASACRKQSLFPSLGILLISTHQHIRKECLWVLSNITAITEACNEVIKCALLPSILKLLTTTFDVKKEAAYTLCNIAAHGDSFCTMLLQQDVFKYIVPLLKSTDADTVHYALSVCEMVLHTAVDEGVKSFEQNGGLTGLETLEYNDNDILRQQADNILDTYFYKDDQPTDLTTDKQNSRNSNV